MSILGKGLEKVGMKSRTDKYKSTDIDGIFADLIKLDSAMQKFDSILGSSGLAEFSSLGYSSVSGKISEAQDKLHILGKVPDMLIDEMSESDALFNTQISNALSGISSIAISDVSIGNDAKSRIEVMSSSFKTKLEGKDQSVQYPFANIEKAAKEVYDELLKQETTVQQQEKLAELMIKYAEWGIDLSTIEKNLDENKLIKIRAQSQILWDLGFLS